MKRWVFAIGGICAAAAGLLILGRRRPDVEELAHHLEEAWADHHTTV
jgi:hypothetical protein